MGRYLLLTIRFHDRRYHGAPEWPPSPARVFQALVAGVARGNALPRWAIPPLEWLQSLPAPVIAAPRARLGGRIDLFVPNNDADAVGGDPARIGEIRIKKPIRPRLLEDETPLMYAWPAPDEAPAASTLFDLAAELYQLGRGVDFAWAVGELIEDDALETRLFAHRGTVHRPGSGETGNQLPCPAPGSLESLLHRHERAARRLRAGTEGDAGGLLFSQPPKPRFTPVAYDTPDRRFLYDFGIPSGGSEIVSWPLSRVVQLITCARDAAVRRLETALPDRKTDIERVLVGRKRDGTNGGLMIERVRIVPLPSIGHPLADRAVRRLLVEVPSGCPLRADDVAWAFSGLEPIDVETGEVYPIVLTAAANDGMLRHYGIADGVTATVWRTVTPAMLPETAARRRIEPARRIAEAKGASERVQEERRAAAAVVQALRHAQIRERVAMIRVQREPIGRRGQRADAFAPHTRFRKERLWHVEVVFGEPVTGPLIIGDGRFLGLGVMAPFT